MRQNRFPSAIAATASNHGRKRTFRNSREHWGAVARLLHWATALLILITFPVGWLANSLERGPTERALFDVHFTFGTVIFVVVAARLVWRLVDPPPKEAPGVARLLTLVARITHLMIYAALIAAFVSGYVIQVHMQPSLHLFGVVHIPRPFEPGEDESMRAFAWYVHTYSVWGLLGLVCLHAGAALWHHFVLGDQTLNRMIPRIRGAHETCQARAAPQQDLEGVT